MATTPEVESDPRFLNIKIDLLGNEVILTRGHESFTATFHTLPIKTGRIPSAHEQTRRILTKEDMRNLTVYESIAGSELSERVGLEWTKESEGFGGKTMASDRTYVLLTSSGRTDKESDFTVATRNLLGERITVQDLQDKVRDASLRIPNGSGILKIGQMDETVQIEMEKMQEEVDDIDKKRPAQKSA